jgi:hypothetical protein
MFIDVMVVMSGKRVAKHTRVQGPVHRPLLYEGATILWIV